MKRTLLFLIPFLLFAIPCLVVTTPGCTTPSKTAYKTLYSVEVTTTAALDSYQSLVIQHKVRTNDLPKISRGFDTFQLAMQVAIAAAHGNSNALAPSSVILQSSVLINDITQAKKGNP